MRRSKRRNEIRPSNRTPWKAPRNTRKPNIKLLCQAFLVSVVVSLGAAYLLQTPALAIKEVRITGVKLGDLSLVQKAIGYTKGRNILIVNKGPAFREICGINEVADVKIGRSLPNRLWVRVLERKPYMIVKNGRNFFMAQADGFIFHKVSGPIWRLPLADLRVTEEIRMSQCSTLPQIRYTLEALKSAQEKQLTIEKISIDHAGNMCLNMDSKLRVILGQPENITAKINKLHDLLEYRPSLASEAAYLNVSCLNAPVMMMRPNMQASLD